MKNAYLLLGSNQGDSAQLIHQGEAYLEHLAGHVLKRSGLYLTQAWGMQGAADFLNKALLIETPYSAEALLHRCLLIEKLLGRKRENRAKYQDRFMDIDILLYDDQIIRKKNLVIPHDKLPERKFALQPLSEIAGELIHPLSGMSIGEMLSACRDNLKVRLI